MAPADRLTHQQRDLHSTVVDLVRALDCVGDWLDLGTTTTPMSGGTLDGQGWLRISRAETA